MAKIQISSVEMTSKAQVIVLNSHFVARAIKAYMKAERALNGIKEQKTERKPNNDGFYEDVPVVDENNNPVYEYNLHMFDVEGTITLVEEVLPFLKELAEALEEGE